MSEPQMFDKPIAWVCETYESGGKTEVRVIREGMTRQEILDRFPPSLRGGNGFPFDRKGLIKSIIYEACLEDGPRPRQNIRGFWYERIMHTLLRVMGESGSKKNVASINTSINGAWKDLTEEGIVTYEELNLYSEKESGYHIAVKEDSPYPAVMILVEKASLYNVLHDIADTYEVSFCCTGGQSSRAAAMAYAARLEDRGIDLNQGFTVFSFYDFDPEGWIMPEEFISHLSLAVTGDINLIRLGLTREQLGDSTIEALSVPYSEKAESGRARKSKRTKYANFVAATGGLYISDGRGSQIPGKMELDIYSDDSIREMIISGLTKHIDAFGYQVRGFKETIRQQYDQAWESATDDIYNQVLDKYSPYHNAIRQAVEKIEADKLTRATDERAEMLQLERRIDELQAIISAKTNDLETMRLKLRELDRMVSTQEQGEMNELIEDLQDDDDIITPDVLIYEVESNGGWREWANTLDLEIAETDVISDAARKHNDVTISIPMDDRRSIRNWVTEKLENSITVFADPYDLESDPDELIASYLAAE